MRPVRVLYERGEFLIEHTCTACTHTRRNRTAPDDDLSAFVR